MTKPKLKLVGVRFKDDAVPAWALAPYSDIPEGADGVVMYSLEDTSGVWEDGLPIIQPFKLGSSATINGVILWGWNGHRTKPSLTPSYAWNRKNVNS